jgi:hypothetical protein
MTVSQDLEVRHGYTLADLEQMTRAAVMADRSMAGDIRGRRDVAWSAIAEALCSAEEPPIRQELIRVGWQAVYREIRDSYRHHGYAERAQESGHGSAPRFAAYWYRPIQPSHEERIVERLAIAQVLSRLTVTYRDAVTALAVADDYMKAAGLLGISYKAFKFRIGKARNDALSLWHEGETPYKSPHRTDRRVGSHSNPLATHCAAGHEWTPDNTYTRHRILRGKRHTSRVCKACEHERSVRRAQEAKERRAAS